MQRILDYTAVELKIISLDEIKLSWRWHKHWSFVHWTFCLGRSSCCHLVARARESELWSSKQPKISHMAFYHTAVNSEPAAQTRRTCLPCSLCFCCMQVREFHKFHEQPSLSKTKTDWRTHTPSRPTIHVQRYLLNRRQSLVVERPAPMLLALHIMAAKDTQAGH